eukprot:comp5766_c0_seq1/m.1621 comp5766_c0_seq1/g.1621  ORF comp5766_c0_seq1/g.1621 comp5766_c0_seq1/m.1621 type:complete len:718 (-) comp5766_c0_seq1:35-2188(-)
MEENTRKGSVLVDLCNQTEHVSDAQFQELAAVIIQTAWRKFKAKRYAKSIRKRHALAMEMRDNEKLYVSNIAYISVLYEQPLRDLEGEGKAVISSDKISAIFQNIQALIRCHSLLSSGLTKRLKRWNHGSTLGDLYAEHAPQMKEHYTSFILNYTAAVDTLNACMKSSWEFKAFVRTQRSTDPNLQSLTLEDLLMMPVQRVPRVEMLLSQLRRHTPPGHQDCGPLDHALALIHDLSFSINQQKSVLEAQHREAKLLRLLEENGIPDSPDRKMILELDTVEVKRGDRSTTRKPRRLFVFNDSVLCAKAIASETTALVGEANYRLQWLANRARTTASGVGEWQLEHCVRAVGVLQEHMEEGGEGGSMTSMLGVDEERQRREDNSPVSKVMQLGRRRTRSAGGIIASVTGSDMVRWLQAATCERWEETVVLCQEMLDLGLVANVASDSAVFVPASTCEYRLTNRHMLRWQDPLQELKEKIEEVSRSMAIEGRIVQAATRLVSLYRGGSTKLAAKKQRTLTTKNLESLQKQLVVLQTAAQLYAPKHGVHIRTRSADGSELVVHTVYAKEQADAERLMDLLNSPNVNNAGGTLPSSPRPGSAPNSPRAAHRAHTIASETVTRFKRSKRYTLRSSPSLRKSRNFASTLESMMGIPKPDRENNSNPQSPTGSPRSSMCERFDRCRSQQDGVLSAPNSPESLRRWRSTHSNESTPSKISLESQCE